MCCCRERERLREREKRRDSERERDREIEVESERQRETERERGRKEETSREREGGRRACQKERLYRYNYEGLIISLHGNSVTVHLQYEKLSCDMNSHITHVIIQN